MPLFLGVSISGFNMPRVWSLIHVLIALLVSLSNALTRLTCVPKIRRTASV